MAFDEVVKGVDAIAHTVSPARLAVSDPQGMYCLPDYRFVILLRAELIIPVVKGTVCILTSAARYGSAQIVCTAYRRHIFVCCNYAIGARDLSEVDWNEQYHQRT